MLRKAIPYDMRPFFKPLHEAEANKIMLIAHRRAGKTVAAIAECVKRALDKSATVDMNQRQAKWLQYYFISTTQHNAVETAWNYFMELLTPLQPHFTVHAVQSDKPRIELICPNGVKIRFLFRGGELQRGSYADGVIMDEFAHQKPQLYDDVVFYMLQDHSGWEIWMTTPWPNPHHYNRYKKAKEDSEWMLLELRPEDTGLYSEEKFAELKAKATPEKWQTEMELSWTAGSTGITYGKYMVIARDEGRIGKVPCIMQLPVHTAWDLGIRDKTAIWFFQTRGLEIRIIDYEERTSQGAWDFANILRDKGYRYGVHLAPHDIAVREFGTNAKTRKQVMEEAGVKMQRLPMTRSVLTGIESVRQRFSDFYFDEENCLTGLDALDRWSMSASTTENKALSHACDALRTLAEGMDKGFFGQTLRINHPREESLAEELYAIQN